MARESKTPSLGENGRNMLGRIGGREGGRGGNLGSVMSLCMMLVIAKTGEGFQDSMQVNGP